MSNKELQFRPVWSTAELLSEKTDVDLNVSRNVIELLEDGATIPFITRYRKDKTGNMDVDQIKFVVSKYQEIKDLESRIQTVCKSVLKSGKMTQDLETSICMSTSVEDVESLYTLYKPAPKGSLAERAKSLGLEQAAQDIMAGKLVQLRAFLNRNSKGLETLGAIEKGVGHIIADIVAKDKEAFVKLRELSQTSNEFILSSSKGKGLSQDSDKKPVKTKVLKSASDPSKFEQYYNFSTSARSPQPHVVLALNRGEECKALSVKVVVPKSVKFKFMDYACRKFLGRVRDSSCHHLIKTAIEDAYDRLMEPMLCRQTRSELTRFAETKAIEVFASNVKCVMLSPPTRNKSVLGVDPGFRNGCKVAVISPMGSVLETDVVYLHGGGKAMMEERFKLARLVNTHSCGIIAIGNGVACRETEMIISEMISFKSFKQNNVVYCIVDECGASIYSVSDQAKKDLPNLDPTLRGAVSIARRLVDPLAEFVKIEPQHLGVGMYQHDVSQAKLQTSLDSVVEECVSFVGVDLNTCSECLLRRVSGLNAAKAKKIIEWREKNGGFVNRRQLLDIKGLGAKGFEQCAGFVRVIYNQNRNQEDLMKTEQQSEDQEQSSSDVKTESRKRKLATTGKTSKSKKAKTDDHLSCNPLDSTAIHPESYDFALSFLKYVGVRLEDLGTDHFIRKVREKSTKSDLQIFTDENCVSFATAELISTALARPITYDIRDGSQKPLFKREVRSMSDLRQGEVLTGRVNNVTHFGAFVDIGVGHNGLIHGSQIWVRGTPKTGDHVSVRVSNIEVQRKRIALFLVEVLQSQSFSKMML